jgi:AcrR family transcriptional regulator
MFWASIQIEQHLAYRGRIRGDVAVTEAVQSAVDRGLAKRRADAARDVEAILDATLRVAERVSPSTPRVADIVSEAGTSNQAFYRYFAGKEDLMRAVYARGLHRLYTYLAHQVEKSSDPIEQIEAWVRGVLIQVTDRTAARQSAAVSRGVDASTYDPDLPEIRGLLRDAIRRAGSRRPDLDSMVVFDVAFATLRRHARAGTVPSRSECNHLVAFALAGLGLAARGAAAPAESTLD